MNRLLEICLLPIGAALLFFVCLANSSYGVSLQFAGRTWDIKQSFTPVGPGPNIFSNSPNDVWSDQDGLHLTIQQTGPTWFSTEVILDQSLGYGTYAFQTDSRQDILDANAVFGAFTWDPFGGSPIPGDPNREIDFEDARWGDPSAVNNSTVTVQPFSVPGNAVPFALPDLSLYSALTRFFTWSPGKVEFTTLKGHHSPLNFAPGDVVHQSTYLDNGADHLVPIPDREAFRFNLWLTESSAPLGGQPVEVLINDFQFIPLPAVADTVLFDFESGSQGWGSFGAIGTDFGELPTGGSSGQGRFHSGDFSLPDEDFGIVDVSPTGQDLSALVGLSVDALFKDVDGQPPFVGVKELVIAVETPSGEEFRAPVVTMTDTYQTFEVAFDTFLSGLTEQPPTPTDLSDVFIKLIVFNLNGTGTAELDYDQIIGLGSIGLDGDYNGNGVVDAADYAVWLDSLGSTSDLAADGDGDGTVGAGDYDYWKARFGNSSSATSLAAPAIPEPATIFLAILALSTAPLFTPIKARQAGAP